MRKWNWFISINEGPLQRNIKYKMQHYNTVIMSQCLYAAECSVLKKRRSYGISKVRKEVKKNTIEVL